MVYSLTKKQQETLNFIRAYQAEHSICPTMQEIGDEFGISRVSALFRVRGLEERGAVRRLKGLHRAIEILET